MMSVTYYPDMCQELPREKQRKPIHTGHFMKWSEFEPGAC